jgi:hypothetical protein
MEGLKVEAVSLDKTKDNHTYRFIDLAHGGNGAFYPRGIPLSAGKSWRLVATSGPDWGCFELSLKK